MVWDDGGAVVISASLECIVSLWVSMTTTDDLIPCQIYLMGLNFSVPYSPGCILHELHSILLFF